jgi:hypothetical protein
MRAAHFDSVHMTALFERLVPAFFVARTLPYAAVRIVSSRPNVSPAAPTALVARRR